MRLVQFASCVLALACLTTSARAEELPGDVTQALGEYAAKRADVMRRADAELAKHKQTLLKKMEKAQQAHKADVGDVPKQIDELMVKINGPAFTTFEIAEILKGNAFTIDSSTAKQLQRAYLLNQVTDAQWESLPAVEVDAKCCSLADTSIDVKPGDLFVICPHPTQKWRHVKTMGFTNYVGHNPHSIALASVEQNIEPETLKLRDSIFLQVKHAGRLRVGSAPTSMSDPEGLISFKIFRVQDR